MDEGYLQVELLDDQDRPIPGFTRKDCPLLTGDGDSRGVCVRWNDVDRAPTAAVKARFYLKRAFLYGFEFVDGDKDESRPESKQAHRLQPVEKG